jgi:hypothetical protein
VEENETRKKMFGLAKRVIAGVEGFSKLPSKMFGRYEVMSNNMRCMVLWFTKYACCCPWRMNDIAKVTPFLLVRENNVMEFYVEKNKIKAYIKEVEKWMDNMEPLFLETLQGEEISDEIIRNRLDKMDVAMELCIMSPRVKKIMFEKDEFKIPMYWTCLKVGAMLLKLTDSKEMKMLTAMFKGKEDMAYLPKENFVDFMKKAIILEEKMYKLTLSPGLLNKTRDLMKILKMNDDLGTNIFNGLLVIGRVIYQSELLIREGKFPCNKIKVLKNFISSFGVFPSEEMKVLFESKDFMLSSEFIISSSKKPQNEEANTGNDYTFLKNIEDNAKSSLIEEGKQAYMKEVEKSTIATNDAIKKEILLVGEKFINKIGDKKEDDIKDL